MQKNNIFSRWAVFLIIGLLGLSISCKQNKKEVSLKYVDMVEGLEKLTTKRCMAPDIYMLKKQYGRVFDVWFNEIMDYQRYKMYPDSIVADYFNYWLQTNKPMFKALDAHYKIHTQWKEDMNDAWGNLQSQLPQTPTPILYGYFSQFSNYNTFVDSANGKLILGFSKEMFMNDTFPLYDMLEVPEFYARYNSPSQIPTMLIWNYLKSKYENEHQLKTMIDQAVFEGKIWSLLKEVQPDKEIYDLLGYTKQEWNMMTLDQGQIWRHLLETKNLFSSDFNAYKRYFIYGNRTFGAGIPPECPPMIGSFIGYQIVQAYLKESGGTYADLFKEHDASKILRISGYNPVK